MLEDRGTKHRGDQESKEHPKWPQAEGTDGLHSTHGRASGWGRPELNLSPHLFELFFFFHP